MHQGTRESQRGRRRGPQGGALVALIAGGRMHTLTLVTASEGPCSSWRHHRPETTDSHMIYLID
eukprot:11169406-Lingulodinium_polyedra.AAC.1